MTVKNPTPWVFPQQSFTTITPETAAPLKTQTGAILVTQTGAQLVTGITQVKGKTPITWSNSGA